MKEKKDTDQLIDYYKQQYADLLGVPVQKLNLRELHIIEKLIKKFPGGFRFIDQRKSNFNCVWYVIHHFFPEEFPYERNLNPKDWFNEDEDGKMKYLGEYGGNELERINEDLHLTAGLVVALVHKEAKAYGSICDSRSEVRHVALVVSFPNGKLAFRSKLSKNDSPTIENYSLGDLVSFNEGITHIQIYQVNN